jgi:alkanesulfonate monooxygenase SsuD/methylene tetrahydromethanopterin reductase-like flavin-dependent oxidoreductase (luciferase family)
MEEVLPQPVQRPHPVIANPGNSEDARAMTARLCDWAFMAVSSIEAGAELSADFKARAADHQRTVCLGARQAPSAQNARKLPRRGVNFLAFRVPAKALDACTPRSRRGPGLHQQRCNPKSKKKGEPEMYIHLYSFVL